MRCVVCVVMSPSLPALFLTFPTVLIDILCVVEHREKEKHWHDVHHGKGETISQQEIKKNYLNCFLIFWAF